MNRLIGKRNRYCEKNLEYLKFLDSLGIEFTKVIVPDVPHSAIGIYEKQGLEMTRFHADNFARVRSSAGRLASLSPRT